MPETLSVEGLRLAILHGQVENERATLYRLHREQQRISQQIQASQDHLTACASAMAAILEGRTNGS